MLSDSARLLRGLLCDAQECIGRLAEINEAIRKLFPEARVGFKNPYSPPDITEDGSPFRRPE